MVDTSLLLHLLKEALFLPFPFHLFLIRLHFIEKAMKGLRKIGFNFGRLAHRVLTEEVLPPRLES